MNNLASDTAMTTVMWPFKQVLMNPISEIELNLLWKIIL